MTRTLRAIISLALLALLPVSCDSGGPPPSADGTGSPDSAPSDTRDDVDRLDASDAPDDTDAPDLADGQDVESDAWPPPGAWRSRLFPADWTPEHTHPDGWFLHDFSYAGYRNSEVALPDLADADVWSVTSEGADPSAADDSTEAFQAAIDRASASGGVVSVPPGTYRLDGTLEVRASNVVIRGDDPGTTRIYFTDRDLASYQSHITFGSGPSHDGEWPLAEDASSRSTVVEVADASGLAIGDDVAIGWTITGDFVEQHGMIDFWQAFNDQWQPFFRREIVDLDTSQQPHRIHVDVPLRYPALVRDGASIKKELDLISDVGIERLGIGDATDWERAWNRDQIHVIEFDGVKDGWMRDVHSFRPPTAPDNGAGAEDHLRSGGIFIRNSKRVTVTDSLLEEAQNRGGGGNGYLFEVRSSSDILFRDCVGRAGRHNFIQNWGFGATGIVWLRVLSEGGETWSDPNDDLATDGYSEFHHSLAMANLIDSSTANDGWGAVNRKAYSSGAGHTATQSVFWNTTGHGSLRSLQYGRGYVIGSGDSLQVDTEIRDIDLGQFADWDGTEPRDWTEGLDRASDLTPASLFEAQLDRRLESLAD